MFNDHISRLDDLQPSSQKRDEKKASGNNEFQNAGEKISQCLFRVLIYTCKRSDEKSTHSSNEKKTSDKSDFMQRKSIFHSDGKRWGPNLNHFSINHFAKQIIQLYQCHVRINISEFCNFTHTARHGTHTRMAYGIRLFDYISSLSLGWACRAHNAHRAVFPAPIVVAMCSTKNQAKWNKHTQCSLCCCCCCWSFFCSFQLQIEKCA